MEFDKEILKGYIDVIILSVLYDEDMYGYTLAKKIIEKSQKEFEIKESTLYVSLKRLEKKGYLIGYWNDSEGTSGGRRRYYSITKEGKESFDHAAESWEMMKSILDNFFRRVDDEKNR